MARSFFQDGSSPWAVETRDYLVLREEAALRRALLEARRASQPGVAALLEALLADDRIRVEAIAPKLYQELEQVRPDDARTVALVDLDFDTRLVSLYARVAEAQRMEALRVGVRACADACQIACDLFDYAAMGYYAELEAYGLNEQGEWQAAVSQYRQALVVYEFASKQRPGVYDDLVARLGGNLSGIYIDQKRTQDAYEAFREVPQLYRSLCERQPEEYKPELAKALHNLGHLLVYLGQVPEALEALRESVILYRQLAAAAPGQFDGALASAESLFTIVLDGSKR